MEVPADLRDPVWRLERPNLRGTNPSYNLHALCGEERAGPHLHRGPGWGRLARSRWGCSRAHARCAREEIVHTPIPLTGCVTRLTCAVTTS